MKPNNIADAVCPSCQRLIVNGAGFILGEWKMRIHPPMGVFIDVKQPDWPQHFIPTFHGQCMGTHMSPQSIVKPL